MSQPIATFEKISFQQWLQDLQALKVIEREDPDGIPRDEEFYAFWRRLYDNIQLPKRATDGSAGYDFHMPYNAAFRSETSTTIPTAIRVKIEPGWMLALFPRSGLGFKHGLRLKNTVGIIDSDYYNAANEGHIMAKIDVDLNFVCNEGERFMQGVFVPYGLATNDDPVSKERIGGFGSTGS